MNITKTLNHTNKTEQFALPHLSETLVSAVGLGALSVAYMCLKSYPMLQNVILGATGLYGIIKTVEYIQTKNAYNKVRKAITEDKELTNSSLIAMLKRQNLYDDEDKVKACYDLAFRRNNPHIYQIAETQVPSDDYNLNFLWVNLNPQNRVQDTAQNIFKSGENLHENAECIKNPEALRFLEKEESSLQDADAGEWGKIKDSFTYKISKWADANPNAEINLWYDSALVTQKAQAKTSEMMRAISLSRGVNLKLRDLRHLPNMPTEIVNSFHPGTPVYFRVDMLKALIGDYMISSQESSKYCVVSDIDVEPMAPEHLFDKRTLKHLTEAGYVFNRVHFWGDFENNFFIFNKEKEGLQKIHHKAMIEQTSARITAFREYRPDGEFLDGETLSSTRVYRQYTHFLKNMKEDDDMHPTNPSLTHPRKVVQSPPSHFNCGGIDKPEFFLFVGDSNIPYTKNGRNSGSLVAKPIENLINWKAEPLPPL